MHSALEELLDPLCAAPEQSGLFLDFDGTLSPIVDDPAAARPLDGVARKIDVLASRFAVVAIVSGRPVEFLQQRLTSSEHVRLRGLYGLQRVVNNVVVEDPDATKWRTVVDEGATTAQAQLPKGIHVERKGMSFVLHYRRSPELATVAEEWAALFASRSGLDAQRARLAIELGPFLQRDKGASVWELTESLSHACVLGDDAGDIPMFEAARKRADSGAFNAVNVAVGSDETPPGLLSVSDHVVSGPDEVSELLDYLVKRSS